MSDGRISILEPARRAPENGESPAAKQLLDAKISVVMPAYNESVFIEKNLMETVATLAAFHYDFEVILVDDGSPDNTHLAAAKVLDLHGHCVRVVRYDENRGKGSALGCGTAFATGKLIAFLDADMDLHPEQLPTLLEMMHVNRADIVVGSKRHPLSHVQYPWHRKLYSSVYYMVVKTLFGLPLRDTQTGLKVFKADALRRVLPYVTSRRFAFDIELLAYAHRLGYKMIDAPVTLQFKRPFGRIGLKEAARMGLQTFRIWWRMNFKRTKHADVENSNPLLAFRYEARELFPR